MNYPADVMNQALDAIGVDFTIGDPQEGTRASQVLLRHYPTCMRNLLRAAHWDFARKQAPLQMLADGTGQTSGVGSTVIAPWVYEYAYPTDCMRARFLPANYLNPNYTPSGNIALPSTPLTTVAQPPGPGMRLIPAPFLIALDTNYPVDPSSNWLELQGQSPAGRVVILSNINMAQLVYTAFMPYPSVWDAAFRDALVAYLGSECAMALHRDKKFALQMRNDQFAIAKQKVINARLASNNESGWPQSVDHLPDFVATRFIGGSPYGPTAPWQGLGAGAWGGWGGAAQMYGWNGCGFVGLGWDNSVF